MISVSLNGTWMMRNTAAEEWVDALVPGSVYRDLLQAGKIADPFYRDNEDAARQLMELAYEYQRSFRIEESLLAFDRVVLRCEGLDTLASIYVNGALLAKTDNMHRMYEFDVKFLLQPGNNHIRISFASPLQYIRQKQAATPLWGIEQTVDGYPHIRKAHSMFGWDWGPQLPDAGIWRDIGIDAYNGGRLRDIYVAQRHEAGHVRLDVDCHIERFGAGKVGVRAALIAPDGEAVAVEYSFAAAETSAALSLNVPKPQIWWPNGYGEQPLYRLDVELFDETGALGARSLQIGLRTIALRREKDEWGESFEFVVNGVPIFAKGANYIPEDSILSRRSRERTERLIQDCVEANFNMLRVWGGGYYPDDDFYALCDRYGLLVWQDFMFACAVYELNDAFAANIRQEAEDNVRRIRHHASLALWCGNNEMEVAWHEWNFPKDPKRRADYLRQFETLLPEVVKKCDPNTAYWPASPSSGGSFDDPNDYSRGDVHYWDVWHGQKPFTEYRKFHFRFCSEYGFQSLPGIKTIAAFTLPQDRNIFSYVMEKHQKNYGANGIILRYLSATLKYPKNLEMLAFASQILQAEAIRYGAEHWRRNRGRCMGSIYWQLNDCWPVASWSSIDYYGRWKALHYFAKRFYASVLLSASEQGTTVELHLTNDHLVEAAGRVVWALCDNKSAVVRRGEFAVRTKPLSTMLCRTLDFSDAIDDANRRKMYLEYRLVLENGETSEGTMLFVQPKHFEFLPPGIAWSVADLGQTFAVRLKSRAFAKYVWLELAETDGRFSDNCFDLAAGEDREIRIGKQSLSQQITPEQLMRELSVYSVFDIDG